MYIVGSGILYCLNTTDGTIHWRYGVGYGGDYVQGGTPAIQDDEVYVIAAQELVNPVPELVALDASTGAVRWRYAGHPTFGTPLAANGRVFVGYFDMAGSGDRGVVAVSIATHGAVWAQELDGPYGPLAYANHTLVVSTRDQGVKALDDGSNTGAVRWTFTVPEGRFAGAGALVAGNHVLVQAGDYTGHWAMYALALADGSLVGVYEFPVRVHRCWGWSKKEEPKGGWILVTEDPAAYGAVNNGVLFLTADTDCYGWGDPASAAYLRFWALRLGTPTAPSSRLAREDCHLDRGPQDLGYYPPGGFVNTFTGNLSHQEVDISIPTRGEPLFLERSYNSLDDTSGPLGRGWTHNYQMRLEMASDDITLVAPRGSRLRYTANGDGTFTAMPGVRATLVQGPSNVYTLTYTNQTQYRFDAAGKLTAIVPANGQATTLSYTGELLTTVTEPTGRALTFAYDSQRRITRVTDPLGRVTGYGYDALGRLIIVTDTLGQPTRYVYDAGDRLLTVTNPAGQVELGASYDSRGRVVTQTDALGHVTAFDYQAGYTVVTDPRGQPLRYNYDARGVLIGRQDAAGGQLTYAPDSNYNPTALTDELGRTTYYEYSVCGCAVTAITDTLGGVTRMTYDDHNNLVQVTGPTSQVTRHAYDARDNLISTTNPLGGLVLYTYDDEGRLTRRTDERGHTTQYGYDQWGNRTVITDALGAVTRMEYDAGGRLLAVTDPLGATTRYGYDALDRLTVITDALGHTTVYEYDAAGRRIRETDANGHVTRYEYDAAGQLLTVTNPLAGTVSYAYDAVGNRIRETDANGHTTTYTYDALSRRVAETDARGGVTRYEYDAVGNTVALTDALGAVTRFQYDARDRLVTTTNALGGVTTYQYDLVGNRTAVTDPLGHTTRYGYDALGRLTSVTDTLGGAESYTYDPAGNRTAVTDANGHTTVLAYDAVNRLITVTDALGGRTVYVYDAAGRRTSVTDAAGHVTRYEYDALGRLVQTTDAANGQTRYSYDAVGNRTVVTDTLGYATRYAYDALSRPITVTNALGSRTVYQYDAVGNRTRVTDPTGRAVYYDYDALNRLGSVTDDLKHTTRYGYNAVGRRTFITDANGIVTAYGYDPLGRLTAVTENYQPGQPPDHQTNVTTVYEYDAAGNLVQVTSPKSQVTGYTYDELNRLVRVTDPLGHTTSYAYDAVGNTKTVTDANGTVVAYTYDPLNRLSAVHYPTSTVQFAYDALGLRTAMTDTTGVTRYGYDALGRLTAVTDGAGEAVQYRYDAAGQRVSLLLPGADQNRAVQYTYDAAGRLTTVTGWDRRTTRYTYDAAGRLTTAVLPNGINARYSYDQAGRLVEVQNYSPTAPTLLSRFRYKLDAAGNRVAVEALDETIRYTYDPLYRLTAEVYQPKVAPGLPAKVTYTYDAAGNRLTQAGTLGKVKYEYDAANRLTAVNGVAYTWDNAGNLLSDGTRKYTWDAAGRLTQACPERSRRVVSGTHTTAYTYNGDGVRVQQVVDGKATRYVQDVAAPLPVVLVERSGLQAAYYLYGLDLIGREQSSPVGPATAWQYYHYDGLGSVRHITDGRGQEVGRYSYYAFGAARAVSGVDSEWRFTGEQWDAGAGLYFLRARYYEPGTGRFVSADPFPGSAWLPQSLNGYCYVGNDPVNYRDPTGLRWEPWGGGLCKECSPGIPPECMDENCNIIAPIGVQAQVSYLKRPGESDLEYFYREDPILLLARTMYGEAPEERGTPTQQQIQLENVGWIIKIRQVLRILPSGTYHGNEHDWHIQILGQPGTTRGPFDAFYPAAIGGGWTNYQDLKNPWWRDVAKRWKWCYAYKMARSIYGASPADIPGAFLAFNLDSYSMNRKPGYIQVSRRGITDELHWFYTGWPNAWQRWRWQQRHGQWEQHRVPHVW